MFESCSAEFTRVIRCLAADAGRNIPCCTEIALDGRRDILEGLLIYTFSTKQKRYKPGHQALYISSCLEMFHPQTHWGGLMVYLGSTFLPTISSLPDVVSAGKKSTVGMRLWCKRVTLETRCTCTLAANASHSGTLWGQIYDFHRYFPTSCDWRIHVTPVMWCPDTQILCSLISPPQVGQVAVWLNSFADGYVTFMYPKSI